jgi:ubiquinone/menaquinone biosynthesis C-methylase UbiE
MTTTQLSLDQTPDGWDATSAKYDEHIPHFLHGYALECIRLAQVASDHEILDVAAGTGVLTLAVARKAARVVAVDFSPEMIEILAGHAARAVHANVTAHVMDAQRLGLPDRAFDRVLCNFGVIFFPDRVQGFREMYRVLRPGGRAVVSAWSNPARFEAFGVFMAALQQAIPNLPAPRQPPAPLSLSDPGKLVEEMRSGGFTDVRVESITRHFEAPSAEVFWTRMESTAPPVVEMFRRIGPDNVARARDQLIGVLRGRFGDGPVRLACEAHYGIGER